MMMISPRQTRISASFLSICLCLVIVFGMNSVIIGADAFSFRPISNHLQQHRPPKPQQQENTRSSYDRISSILLAEKKDSISSSTRRNFLEQQCSAFAAMLCTGTAMPVPALAESDEEPTVMTEPEPAIVEKEKLETIIKDEVELDAEILQEEKDEKKSIEDEKKLIKDLEEEVNIVEKSDASSLSSEELQQEEAKIKTDTEALIEEEEKIKSETEAVINKIETMESEVKALDTPQTSPLVKDDNAASPPSSAEVFVNKLKERVEEQEDLITKLKRQSEKDIDPKTGKFKSMSSEEYKERVKSTDVDFIQFLKDTIANKEEWERDLEAFEDLLDREFGPAVKELRKISEPLTEEVRKDVAPVVGDAMQQLKEKAKSAAADIQVGDAMQQLKEKAKSTAGDSQLVDDLKHRAEGLIGQLRGIF